MVCVNGPFAASSVSSSHSCIDILLKWERKRGKKKRRKKPQKNPLLLPLDWHSWLNETESEKLFVVNESGRRKKKEKVKEKKERERNKVRVKKKDGKRKRPKLRIRRMAAREREWTCASYSWRQFSLLTVRKNGENFSLVSPFLWVKKVRKSSHLSLSFLPLLSLSLSYPLFPLPHFSLSLSLFSVRGGKNKFEGNTSV